MTESLSSDLLSETPTLEGASVENLSFRAMPFEEMPFEEMLERMYASDRSANGSFLTGVLTTGIYCLPSCPARKPKAENVRFFASEEDAQKAGLRACKRCRPEDFYAGKDGDCERLLAAVVALEQEPAAFPDVASLASEVGCGVSKLYPLAKRCLRTTPAEILHSSRIRVAKRLLREQAMGPAEVAFAVGYGSLSAFYERFKYSTGFTPKVFAQGESGSKMKSRQLPK